MFVPGFVQIDGLLDIGRTLNSTQDVNFAFYSPHCQATFGMEEGRAERPGGKMVRKGCQKPRKEAEEDWTTGRTGEGHHHPEYQHEMHHYTEVTAV